ncbi:universal stress protein [soil metagenome]
MVHTEVMTQHETIVGWDGTEPAKIALDWAVARERARSGSIHIVGVMDDTRASADYFATDADARAFESRLQAEAQRVGAANPNVHVDAELRRGDPLQTMVPFAASDHLVVVGTHRRNKPYFTFGWSLGAQLAAEARGPVAVIPEPPDDVTERHGVLVGIDGSATARDAAFFAGREATRTGQNLTLLHAWQLQPVWQDALPPSAEYLDSLARRHQDILDAAQAEVNSNLPGLITATVLVQGPPAKAILDASKTAALVVVGNHRPQHPRMFLLGSVSHAVVVRMEVPTIVYAPKADD